MYSTVTEYKAVLFIGHLGAVEQDVNAVLVHYNRINSCLFTHPAETEQH